MENHHAAVNCPSDHPSAAVRKKALVVDDESLMRQSLKMIAEEEGFLTLTAGSGVKALKHLEQERPDLVILDIQLPDTNGLSLLKMIKDLRPDVPVIMITGHADIRSSVEAMKMGAFDYLEKPIDFENLRKILETIKKEPSPRERAVVLNDFVFVSEKMREVVRIMECLAAKSDVTVLVLGESGTGKSLLCRKMHELSPRRPMPFVEVGCSSIPDHLIESELFGYEKGAFTDAKAEKKGLIEIAQGGSVFLDEIGDMPYPMQSKILSLIEEKKFRRIGGLQYLHADVRIFAATNRNLHDLVKAKKFRLDLFYRLNGATIEIPRLRDRREDISILTEHYLDHYAGKYNVTNGGISPEVIDFFTEYEWPGNVREIKNLLERLIILSQGRRIEMSDLPPNLFLKEKEIPVGEPCDSLSIMAMQHEFIKTALKLSDGNQRKAAELLHITRDTLRYRLKKFGIDPSLYKESDE